MLSSADNSYVLAKLNRPQMPTGVQGDVVLLAVDRHGCRSMGKLSGIAITLRILGRLCSTAGWNQVIAPSDRHEAADTSQSCQLQLPAVLQDMAIPHMPLTSTDSPYHSSACPLQWSWLLTGQRSMLCCSNWRDTFPAFLAQAVLHLCHTGASNLPAAIRTLLQPPFAVQMNWQQDAYSWTCARW
jgi:hypothetical protein